MYIVYDDNIINYEEFIDPNNEQNMIVLHGWRQNISQFRFLKNKFKNTNLYLIDLPNFGESTRLKKSINLDYYVDFLKFFIEKKELKNILLLGHSFGGRIIIKYLNSPLNAPVKKIILVDSAGIRPKRTIQYYWKIYTYKLLKRFNKKFVRGSIDYRNADAFLRGTLSKVVNEDLKDHLHKIKVPTLLVWGSEDKVTPLADAYKMNQSIENSELAILPGAGHFSYENCKEYFIALLREFIYG